MTKERRSPAEMMRAAKAFGEEKELLLKYWHDRLADLAIPPERPVERRLSVTETGLLALDLSGTSLSDLNPLKEMPLERLNLTGCSAVVDLTPLRKMPLRHLYLGRTFADYSEAALEATAVRNLTALRELNLLTLDLEGTQVSDLSPLTGMPIEWLSLRETPVTDISTLKGMPLKFLDCTMIKARDFSPLQGAPLETLSLQSTLVSDLSFIGGMPLKTLLLNGCLYACNYQAIDRINTLENLMLPNVAQLPFDELNAISGIKRLPRIERIQIGGSRQDGMAALDTEPNTAIFWNAFETDLCVRNALQSMSAGKATAKKLKRTWELWFTGLPVSDLKPLWGAPISTLDLTGTAVIDLTPLQNVRALNLRLYLSRTKVNDLNPLRTVDVKEVYLEGCPIGLDLTPLASISSLTHVLLPPEPRNLGSLRNLPNLERISFRSDGEYDRIAQSSEEFWTATSR
jgi:hypothetical protein